MEVIVANDHQYGFQKNKETETAILDLRMLNKIN